ncbi:ribonuclease H-like domain-containing protein [Tanacetum coccineum]
MTQTVPSKSTANVFYQGTARPRVPQAVLSQSTGRPYYPRMDNIRPRTSSFSPSTRSSTTRTPHRPQRPKKIMKSIWVKKESTVGSQAVLPQNVSVKGSAMINPTQTWRPKGAYLDSVNRDNGSYTLKQFEYGNPEEDLKDYAIIDSGCSGSMTGDKDKLSDFKEFKGGYVAFGNDPKGGRITGKGKGTIKTKCIDLKSPLSGGAEVQSPIFYGIEDLATKDEAVLWHRRLGHVNFKNINKLVKGNLVRGLPSKTFKLDHSCLACRKGKQHRASCKKIEERTVREPLELLQWKLFGTWFQIEIESREKYSIARTPQQNGVTERKNRTLIEAARTMLADSLLPIQFWAEAVNTACYVLNRVLIYWVSLMASQKEAYLLGYATSSKGFRVKTGINAAQNKHLEERTAENVADLLTKGFDLARFNFLVVTIGMMNP